MSAPQWAIKRARELSAEPMREPGFTIFDAAIAAFAAYIAAHEEPPVDPLQAVVAEAYDAIWIGRDGIARENAAKLLTVELRARGIELAKTGGDQL